MRFTYFKNRMLQSEKGSSVVIFAISLAFIAGCAALTIDIGALVADKSKLSASVDAAALAGVQELITASGNELNIINDYMSKNIGAIKAVDTDISPGSKRITVTATKTAENYFLKMLGLSIGDIEATATAKADNITSLSGARPFAVVQQDFIYGQVYTLKEGGGDGTTGNYAAMALGGSGASVYGNNLLNGYSEMVSVGDTILTETGNIAGITQTNINQLIQQCDHTPVCTYNYYNPNCPKIVFIPVVNTLEINGKKYVTVLGFATFFLEGTVNHGGQTDIVGRFITYSMQGETSSEINDYGTYGIRLIK
ncbi:MAG: hypothetical protein FIA99_12300 [Ruminiclostridium sp.]|nr:hypothetical protein [Ruminiclostridium sp.]